MWETINVFNDFRFSVLDLEASASVVNQKELIFTSFNLGFQCLDWPYNWVFRFCDTCLAYSESL